MKNASYSIKICSILILFSVHSEIFSQATGDNTPGFWKYLGFSGAQDLELRTNNTTYMRLLQNGTTNINGSIMNTSGFLGLHTDFPRIWRKRRACAIHYA